MKEIGKYLYEKRPWSPNGEDNIVEGCGDDPAIAEEGSNSFRVYFQNICGLKLQRSANTVTDIVGFFDTVSDGACRVC